MSSRTLAQYSTDEYAGGLYFRVRNGTGCYPAAMAVRPIRAIPDGYISFIINYLEGVAAPSCVDFGGKVLLNL